MVGVIRHAAVTLQHAAATEALDELSRTHGIRVLMLFGSAADPAIPDPQDLDIAYLAADETDHLALFDALADLVGSSAIDLVNLRRASPTLRARAMSGFGLYESDPGLMAQERDLALRIAADTAWIRRHQLETLAR